jgi:hypothetical protein
MKITLTWTPPGASVASNFVLADSPAVVPITNFRINGGRILQQAQFFRADAAKYYDRGNRHTTVSFETTRQFPDATGAETFVLMHETQFPGQFLVIFTAGRGGSSANSSRYLANAVVESVSTAIIGCTTRHSYRITGGTMSTSPK